MSEYTIEELLDQAEDYELYDVQPFLLAQQAEKLAEASGRPEDLFLTKAKVAQYASHVDKIEEAMVAVAWCFANRELLDEIDPQDQYRFLWMLKNLLRKAVDLPAIRLEQIERVMQQTAEWYDEYGIGDQVIHLLRAQRSLIIGDTESMRQHWETARTLPRDSMSDCLACEADHRVHFCIALDDDEQALEIAKPILEGELSCSTVPHRTYSTLLYPLLRLGRLDQARQMHQAGYPKVHRRVDLVDPAALHIAFDVREGNTQQALERFEANVHNFMEITAYTDRYSFLVAAEFLFEVLGQDQSNCSVTLPKNFPLHREDGQYETATLREYFRAEAQQLAEKFDRRNGNDHYSNQHRKELRLEVGA